MSKRLVILAVAVLAVLVTLTPALAAGGEASSASPQQFTALGAVTAIDGRSITLQVVEGSRLVWPAIGQPLNVQTTPATLYYQWTPDGLVPIELGEIEVGDAASIHGTVAGDGVFTASRVIISPRPL